MSWALELAERALEAAPDGDALVQVTAERSLTMRCPHRTALQR